MQSRKLFAISCRPLSLFGLMLMAVVLGSGCSSVLTTPPVNYPSILKAAVTSPDSVTLEIFQVRIPANEPKLAKGIWQAIDEQRIDLELRRKLVKNGFRVGVLGSSLPDELSEQLNLQDEMPEVKAERLITGENANPRITRRVLQLNQHKSAVIQATEVQEEVTVMIGSESGLTGEHFEEVEAVYTMRAKRVPGQRVQLRLTPELLHGELRNRYSAADQGIFLMSPSRERETYDQLKLITELQAGEMLVMSCQEDASRSLGHAFHGVDQHGPAEQKLVLIRLLQIPGSEILADAGAQ